MRKFLLAAVLTCPITSSDLSSLNISYWGLDHHSHLGVLIINKNIKDQVKEIFEILYQSKFPIAKIKPLEDYNYNEKKALEDNDTFGYNCRMITGSQTKFSKHAYGLAIDINPVFNPYINNIKHHIILPQNSSDYLNRNLDRSGMILPDSIITKTFKKYGWHWGGDWKSLKDYHHFER